MSNFVSKLRYYTYGGLARIGFYYKNTGLLLNPFEARPQTAVDTEHSPQRQSVLSLLGNTPNNRIILADESGEYTAGELKSRVRRLAYVLKYECHIKPRETVGIMTLTEKEMIEATLAAWAIRARAFPVNIANVDDTIACSLLNARTKTLIVGQKDNDFAVGAEKIRKAGFVRSIISIAKPSHPEIKYYEDLVTKSPMLRSEYMCFEPLPNDPALILETSGTDGTPRAVEYTHGMILESTNLSIGSFPIKEEDVILFDSSFHHLLGIIVWIGAMNFICRKDFKGKIVLTDLPTLKHEGSVDRAVDNIKRHDAAIVSGPPVILERIINRALERKESLPSVCAFYSGGAPMTPNLISLVDELNEMNDHQHKKRLHNVYAGTEFSIASVTDNEINYGNYACVGKVINGVEVRLNKNGVLEVNTPGKPRGYFNRPDLNRVLFTRDGYVVTGDLIDITEDDGEKLLTFKGREKEVLNINGEETSPGEVDRIISTHRKLRNKLATVCAFGVIHPESQTHMLCALIVPKNGVTVSGEEIDTILKEGEDHVPCKLRPKYYFIEGNVPERCKDSAGCINGSGKIAKRLVANYYKDVVRTRLLNRAEQPAVQVDLNESTSSTTPIPSLPPTFPVPTPPGITTSTPVT